MWLAGPGIILSILGLAALLLGRRVAAWVPERKKYVIGFAAFGGVLLWIVFQATLLDEKDIAIWQIVIAPVVMGCLGALACLVILLVHLLVLDGPMRSLQNRLLSVRSVAGVSWQRGMPFMSLFTPIDVLQARRGG
jgi:hypothetical protein